MNPTDEPGAAGLGGRSQPSRASWAANGFELVVAPFGLRGLVEREVAAAFERADRLTAGGDRAIVPGSMDEGAWTNVTPSGPQTGRYGHEPNASSNTFPAPTVESEIADLHGEIDALEQVWTMLVERLAFVTRDDEPSEVAGPSPMHEIVRVRSGAFEQIHSAAERVATLKVRLARLVDRLDV